MTDPADDADHEAAAMRKLRERLIAGHEYATAEINAAVERAIAYFADAQIRDFVPLLVERFVRDDLGRGGQRG